MDAGVANIRNFQARSFDPALEVGEHLVGTARCAHGDVLDTHLFGEGEVLVREFRPDLQRDLDSRREGFERTFGSVGGRRGEAGHPQCRHKGAARRELVRRSSLFRHQPDYTAGPARYNESSGAGARGENRNMGFLAQLDGFDPGSLDPLQRILLVTDGTLTDTLEAAFWEPIGLRKIALQIVPARQPVEDLDLAPGELVLDRKIVLYGETTGKPYIYAESQLALGRLPPGFRDELMRSDTPMGRLWSEYRLETWKELLHVGRHAADQIAPHLHIRPETECLLRRYRLISGGRPLMVIQEQFPVSYQP